MFKYIGFIFVLTFGLMSNSSAFVIAPSHNHATNINPSDIYTIVAKPIEGDTAYRLSVFQEGDATAAMTVTRPLDDHIIDIVISDVDYDGKEELVVFMQEESVELQKLHFDVFEFERTHLEWVEDFSNSVALLAIFQSNENEN